MKSQPKGVVTRSYLFLKSKPQTALTKKHSETKME
jgi:hypothetical protein